MRLREAWELIKTALTDWNDANAPRMGAALAYYTAFSLAPSLLMVVVIAGAVLGEQEARARLSAELPRLVGDGVAAAVDNFVAQSANRTEQGRLAAVLGLAAMIFGATGAFLELKSALNRMLDVEPKSGGFVWQLLRNRLWSFAMVLCLGAILAVSVAFSAAVRFVIDQASHVQPLPSWMLLAVDWLVAFGVTTLLFACLFKLLPDAYVPWRAVWFGALVTAGLFTFGKVLLGLYLGNVAVGSAQGAAGALIIILTWTYYSAQVVLLGAELTQAFAKRRGLEIVPAAYAKYVSDQP